MESDPAYDRGEQRFVPPEKVMTRLMRRPARDTGVPWVGYLLLATFMAGVMAGLFLAAGG